jgi:hypothetical protein
MFSYPHVHAYCMSYPTGAKSGFISNYVNVYTIYIYIQVMCTMCVCVSALQTQTDIIKMMHVHPSWSHLSVCISKRMHALNNISIHPCMYVCMYAYMYMEYKNAETNLAKVDLNCVSLSSLQGELALAHAFS